jgi:23S rRNA (cytidine1920-2'-O)/16S rRNA (cytidine1409-2'-O)-methyltransferase
MSMATKAARTKDTRRIRLDVALVERGLVPTRARAQAAVLAGEVYVNGARATKAGMTVPSGAHLELRSRRPAFVSRGGIKLDHALTVFKIDVGGKRAADIGSSTGGFTDCLLRRGAKRVYAIDVGTGQLDWSLRNDPRVVSLEQRDVREVRVEDLEGPVDVATVDVSFISLTKVLPAVRGLVAEGASVVTLVKPQFEAGPKAAKHGVVREAEVHLAVLREVASRTAASGFSILDATHSPIAGPDGNIEYFLHLRAVSGEAGALDESQTPDESPAPDESLTPDLASVVAAAHSTVRRKGERS